MVDLNNTPSSEIPKTEPREKKSPWIILISMILLILGLLLTSTTFVYYALQNQPTGMHPDLKFSALISRGQKFKDKLSTVSKIQETTDIPKELNPKSVSEKKFFQDLTNHVMWPRLKLSGFGKAANGTGGFAIINGKQISVGEHINNVKLVEIRTHEVIVELKGEQKSLTVGSLKNP